LATTKQKKKRSKIPIMLLPALIVMFLIGWCMYYFGGQKKSRKIQPKPNRKDNLTFIPINYEETQEIINE